MKYPEIGREIMPNDPDGIPKAVIWLNGRRGLTITPNALGQLIDAIYDYEDEKYKHTGKGVGRDYTERKLLGLLYAKTYHAWVGNADPNFVMQRRPSWETSLDKIDVRACNNGVVIEALKGQAKLYPSFADLFRIFKAFTKGIGGEHVESAIRGFHAPLFRMWRQ